MHYLVTGGCGFIGSHLLEGLLAAGHTATVIDDLSTGKRENLPAGVTFIHGDITTAGIFDDILKTVDGCFHLAAIASVQKSKEEWLRTHQVNLGGTIALFDAIIRSTRNIPVVFASSAAVYGANNNTPLAESDFCEPLSAYGADKHACEPNARIATELHGIPTAGMRFFNVYGPRQDPHSPYSGVISIFAGRMKNNQPLTIFGDGEQSRDFIFVKDVVVALTSAMRALESGVLKHGIFNVCTGIETTVNQLAQLLRNITHSRSTITYGAPREGDIRISLGDPTKLQHILGFKATTSLADGLQQTVDYL
jgi:UDP-glucose 4-epimerase